MSIVMKMAAATEVTEDKYLAEVLSFLPPHLQHLLAALAVEWPGRVEELRFRQGRPLAVGIQEGEAFIDRNGRLTEDYRQAQVVEKDDLERIIQSISSSSLYALEEELKNGFITLPGGHRVGLTGRTVLEQGRIKTMKYISGLNLRVSRELPGVAGPVLQALVGRRGQVYHTMLVSPPRCGKTTLLRDIIRQLSNGIPELGFQGITVGVVDERSEIAGCYRGVPQRDVGRRTDVLDGCPKAAGMMMLVRTMAPGVVATDEIGRREDVVAIEEIFNAGVKVLTTVHGSSLEELARRPALKYLFDLKMVERFIILGRSRGVGTVELIVDGRTMRPVGVNQC